MFFYLLALALICSYLSAKVATSKKWDGKMWALLGFLFGPIGLIGAAGLPDRELRKTMRLLAEAQGVEINSSEPDKPLQK